MNSIRHSERSPAPALSLRFLYASFSVNATLNVLCNASSAFAKLRDDPYIVPVNRAISGQIPDRIEASIGPPSFKSNISCNDPLSQSIVANTAHPTSKPARSAVILDPGRPGGLAFPGGHLARCPSVAPSVPSKRPLHRAHRTPLDRSRQPALEPARWVPPI